LDDIIGMMPVVTATDNSANGPVRYPPVGMCIYCGATRYDDQVEALSDEHILPLGLAGEDVLPAASCRKCQTITGRWEQRWGNIDPVRQLYGLQNRRRQRRREREGRTTIDVFVPPHGKRRPIPWQDYPATPILPFWGAPRLFNPAPPFEKPNLWWRMLERQTPNMAWKYNIWQFNTVPLDIWALMRVLAKIAHAYTAAAFGIDGFVAILPNYIIGDNDGARHFYVGSELNLEPESELLHRYEFEPPTVEQWEFIVVRLRLFANLGAPTFRVVSGYHLEPTKPLELQLAEANALHSPLGMPAHYRAGLPIPEGPWDPTAPCLRGEPSRPPLRHAHAKVTLTLTPRPPASG
jgi:hypothetical protein